jgi:hypothetical protein
MSVSDAHEDLRVVSEGLEAMRARLIAADVAFRKAHNETDQAFGYLDQVVSLLLREALLEGFQKGTDGFREVGVAYNSAIAHFQRSGIVDAESDNSAAAAIVHTAYTADVILDDLRHAYEYQYPAINELTGKFEVVRETTKSSRRAIFALVAGQAIISEVIRNIDSARGNVGEYNA